MSDDEKAKMSSIPVARPGPPDEQGELFPEDVLRGLLRVEQARIESQNKRTEVQRMAVQASDDADKRQFEYHMERLRSQERQTDKRLRLLSRIVFGGGVLFAVLSLFIILMAFFGDTQQREAAFQLLKVIGILVAGYGLGEAARRGIRGLLRNAQE